MLRAGEDSADFPIHAIVAFFVLLQAERTQCCVIRRFERKKRETGIQVVPQDGDGFGRLCDHFKLVEGETPYGVFIKMEKRSQQSHVFLSERKF